MWISGKTRALSNNQVSRGVLRSGPVKPARGRESSACVNGEDARFYFEETPLCPNCLAEVFNLQFCPSCHVMLVEEHHSGC